MSKPNKSTGRIIEYRIRVEDQDRIFTKKVCGEPIVFKGFESLRFCVRKDVYNQTYNVDELSTGHSVAKGTSRKAAITAAQMKLVNNGLAVVKKTVTEVIAKNGRLNTGKEKEVKRDD